VNLRWLAAGGLKLSDAAYGTREIHEPQRFKRATAGRFADSSVVSPLNGKKSKVLSPESDLIRVYSRPFAVGLSHFLCRCSHSCLIRGSRFAIYHL
jgi:hypothetical protein